MIVINDDQIEQIVEKLIRAGVSTCDRTPREIIQGAVCKWLNDHIDSIVEDADWWVRNTNTDLRDYGLPYEDEIDPSFLRLQEIIDTCDPNNKLKLLESPTS